MSVKNPAMAGFFFGETAMTNVDPLELAKFDEHAHHWWDPTSEFRPLHEINPLRLSWIESHVTLAGKRVLDVGCGGGILSEGMAQRGAKVTGIDLSAAALDVAKLHLLESGLSVDYRLESAEDHAEAHPGAYEVVTCMELLEHVPDPESIVAACAATLAPGGWAFFATINRTPKAYLHAILGAEYLLRLLPRGTHDFGKFIRPAELARWARSHGLEPVALKGLGYNPLTKTYRLIDETAVNYLLAARKAT